MHLGWSVRTADSLSTSFWRHPIPCNETWLYAPRQEHPKPLATWPLTLRKLTALGDTKGKAFGLCATLREPFQAGLRKQPWQTPGTRVCDYVPNDKVGWTASFYLTCKVNMVKFLLNFLYLKYFFRAAKMAQWVKSLLHESNYQSSIPRTHGGLEGQTWYYKVVLWYFVLSVGTLVLP